MLIVIVAPTTQPVTVADAKVALRIEHNAEDIYVEQLIRAAIEAVESHTTLILSPRTLQERFDHWCDPIEISRAPVRDVLAVAYLDDAGVEQTVPPADYDWDRTTEGAEIVFRPGVSKPSVARHRKGAVRVTFEAGYDDPAEAPAEADPDYKLPERARQAMLYLAGHWYANREAVNVGNIVNEVPLGFERLVSQLRVYR